MPAFQTSDVIALAAVAAFLLLFVGVGAAERARHRRTLERLPLRISVNGSRGKSTVVRLLAGALAAGGYRPLGKTTGTEPRLIHAWSGEEEDIHRRPEGANIGEQLRITRQAARLEADSMVAECMAVTPEYQSTFHRELLDANVLVITNVLDDHLDVMGPEKSDAAGVFADTIPEGGILVTTPGPFDELFAEEARRRGTVHLRAEPDKVDAELLRTFGHLVFAEHVALVLALTEHLGIPRGRAIPGMRQAPADPYATRILPVGDRDAPATFVNAFPANDPTSTLAIWEHVKERGHPEEKLVVVVNCRADRVSRTELFATDVLPHLPIDTLVVLGESTQPILRAVRRGDVAVRELHDATGEDPREAIARLDDELRDRVVFGVGNLHGGGTDVVRAFEERAVSAGAN